MVAPKNWDILSNKYHNLPNSLDMPTTVKSYQAHVRREIGEAFGLLKKHDGRFMAPCAHLERSHSRLGRIHTEPQ